MSSINLYTLYFFESEALNKYNKLWLLILVLIYLFVVLNTIYWYFFPHPVLYLIFFEIGPFSLIIQLGIILIIILGLIKGFYITKKAYNEERSKMVPILAVVLFSVPIPLLSFINNFTGNFKFSFALIVFGVIYTILAFRFR